MKKSILLFAGLAFLTFKNQAQSVTDIDGNVYNTITIGTQVWMKENLKVTHYNNGDSIQNVTDGTQWSNLEYGAYCNYNNALDSATTYGRLYNWYAIKDSHNIAPIGWHVPSDSEWVMLTTYLDGESVAGGKLKETGTAHWQSPNAGATNESGFTALPGGYRGDNGIFGYIGFNGYWWTSTVNDTSSGWCRALSHADSIVHMLYGKSEVGLSVRLVKDPTAQINEFNHQEEIKIYPNPANGRVSVDCAERKNLKIQIYNVIGECVLQRELHSGTNDIDISSLTKGIYVIKVSGIDWSTQRKLIKE